MDAEGDVIFEWNAEFGGAVYDVVAIYAAGEGFVFELLFHGCGFDVGDFLRWFDESAGGEETGEFVAGKKRVLERRDALDARIVCVALDRANHFFGIAEIAKD